VHQCLQEDGLGHPDGIRIFGHDSVEGKLTGGLAINTDEPFGQDGMGLPQDILEQPQLIEQMRGARLEDFAPKLAMEGLVAFEDNDVHATFGQQ
jgi:hypothetical protein